MLGIIGKKIGMTRIYDEEGKIIPCTVVQGGPCTVTQIKEASGKDRYNAVQVAFDEKKEKNTSQALKKHFEKAKTTPKKRLVEFRGFAQEYKGELQLGTTITLSDLFEEGEFVDVVGRSKGKGFQGVVKRHNFSGVGDRSHGQHNRERAPGSIGAGSDPSRVFKGMRMAGRDGNKRIKVKNLKVMKIIPEEHCIVLKGAIPGAKNGYVILEK